MDPQPYDTPKKARIRGAYDYCKCNGIDFDKKDLFEFFDVTEEQGLEILDSDSDRTGRNDGDIVACGTKRKSDVIATNSREESSDEEGVFEAKGDTNTAKRTARSGLKRRQLEKRRPLNLIK